MDAVLIIFISGLSLAQFLESKVPFTDMMNNDAILVQVPDVDHYFSFLYDESHGQIIVGAKDHLLQFDLGLNLKQKVELRAPGETVQNCIQSHPADECHNFIKVLHSFREASGNESFVYACGTHSYDPVCFWREGGNIMSAVAQFDGHDSCPSNPHAPTTSWFNASPSKKLLFLGTSFGYDTNQGAIKVTRMIAGNIPFRTRSVQGLSKLHNAEFVGSFESSSFLFLAFREENALEYPIPVGVTSRIARVCTNADWWLYHKDDKTNLVSFTKAKIECGEFTSVQAISFVGGSHPLLFATFQSPHLEGSAICVYHLRDIDNVFSSDNFWCQKSSQPPVWDECHSRLIRVQQDSFVYTCYGKRDCLDVEDRILLKQTIVPICGGPIYSTNTSKLSLLDVKPDFGGFRAVVVGDKKNLWTFIIRDCIVSLERIWQVIPATERSESINFLVQLFDEVYVLTNRGVMVLHQKDIFFTSTRETTPIVPNSTRSPSSEIYNYNYSGKMLHTSPPYPLHIIHAPSSQIEVNFATMTRLSSILSLLLMVCVTMNISVR